MIAFKKFIENRYSMWSIESELSTNHPCLEAVKAYTRECIEEAFIAGFRAFEEVDRNYDPTDREEGIKEALGDYLNNTKLL